MMSMLLFTAGKGIICMPENDKEDEWEYMEVMKSG